MSAIQTYLSETWWLIAEMGPYLLLGFIVAGALHRWVREEWIVRKLGSRNLKSIVRASLVGVPMPLCSCGVIPVTASLRAKGASKGAATSFLTSTPQTGVDSILATYGMLGPVFALYRVIVAFVSGIAVGAIVDRFSKSNDSPPTSGSKDSDKVPTWGESFRYGVITLPGDIAISLTIGFLLAGLISALAPDDLLAHLPGGVVTSILLTTLIATPFYICSTGSIPLALALIESGLPTSSALVLLIAGPATNIATIATMKKTLGGRETAIYVACLILISWIAAFVFHFFLDTSAFHSGHSHLEGLQIWHHVTGALLLAMLAYAFWSTRYKESARSDHDDDPFNDSEVATLTIQGMTCSHCRDSVLKGLQELPFARNVAVNLAAGVARIGGTGIDIEVAAKKVESLGYTVVHSDGPTSDTGA